MTCTCPKCRAKIEIDLPEVSEAGTQANCPACNGRFTVHRESFGARALHKTGEISCAPCGAELGAELHCPSCGAQFPDYLVVGTGRKRRRATTKVKLKISPLPQKSTTQLPSMDMPLKPEAAKAPARGAASGVNRKLVSLAIIVLVILALAGGGTAFYKKSQAEQTYVKNFVLASYCIQTGVDRAQKAIAKKSAEWKAQTDAGQVYTARASVDDERDFGIIGGRMDPAVAKLSRPPQKFASCSEKVAKIQGVYAKMRNLALNPGASLQTFTEQASKLDVEYQQAVKVYKTDLPEEIEAELISASQKFKGLRPLLR